ncbi:MAG: hypothetical protein H6Q71_106 [Firmicutes bacterium]|nr:hypothetical protein [Bacillota bacterium]
MNHILDILKTKGILYLAIVFLLMVSSTAAWLYFSSDIPKKTPLRAKQVLLWHNNQNTVQTKSVKPI